jgi:hypothetical protein
VATVAGWQWFLSTGLFSYFLDVFVRGVCEQGRHALVRGGGWTSLVPIDAARERGHFDVRYMVAVVVVAGSQWVYWRSVVL